MSALADSLADYLALRRALGYKLERAGALLADFVTSLDEAGVHHITVEAAAAWAMRTTNPDSSWRAQRLGIVRGFARYLHAVDPTHQIPPPRLLHRGHRPEPFLYTQAEIAALMASARRLRTPLRALTMETIIGLVSVTGLRVSEVIRLDRGDVDVAFGQIVVRHTKLGRTRPVPILASTSDALAAYLQRRDELLPKPICEALFISRAGTRLRPGNLRAAFVDIVSGADIPARPGRPGRLGDMRHSFAVQTLHDWHSARVDVGPLLPVLSTYLGHVSPASTYWYLSASPSLLAAAARRLPSPEVST